MSTTLEESARRAGAHHWAESRLFEILGGWVATTAEPDARLLLDRHSRHAAWRAAQWWDRLPVLADVDRYELCAPPSTEVERAAGRLSGTEGTVARLAAAYRVALPRQWASYDRHRASADAVADSSTLWTVGIVAPDLAADWHEGEAVLQQMLGGASAVREAADAVVALEVVLAAAD